MQACFAEARRTVGGSGRRRRRRRPSGGGLGGGGGGGRRRPRRRPRRVRQVPARAAAAVPRARSPRREQTLQQVLNPPQTNIKSRAYTIGGVDQTHPTMGVVTAAQVTKGRFLAQGGRRGARLRDLRGAQASLKVGSKLDLNGTKFIVVGLVNPPLGGQTRRRLPAARAAADARRARRGSPTSCSSAPTTRLGRRRAEADRDGVPAGAGRELEAGRGHDQRLARRRVEPLARSRVRALDRRGGRRVPARRAARRSRRSASACASSGR